MTDTLRDRLGALTGYELAGCADRAEVVLRVVEGKTVGFPVAADWDRFAKEVRKWLAAQPAPAVMGEGLRETQLRLLLFECIRELSYVQCVENCNSGLCATSLGEDLVQRGIKLLGVRDLHERIEEQLQAELRTAAAESREERDL